MNKPKRPGTCRANRRFDWVSALLVIAAVIFGLTAKHWF